MKKYLKLIRVEQYIKNAFVFAPLFFGKAFLNPSQLLSTLIAFTLFCFAASSIYILNDYFDIEEDKLHPEKRNRPLASGTISIRNAFILMVIFSVGTLITSYYFSFYLFLILSFYIFQNFLYSRWLKHIAILDVNIIAIGFVLRILSGAIVTEIKLSIWILLITYIFALFIGFAKRRSDVILAQNGQKVRKNIDGYNLVFIDITLGVLSSVLIVSYIFYCISPEVQKNYHSELLYLSILFVINGILRYLKLALVNQSTYSPTLIVLKDFFLQIIILCWILLMSYLLYVNP
ncbi:4-hydroxybenzoate polyprenyltransferase [Flavobacterium arsenatis]|uniref:4-hydroxybenzoate polyprenyltransferase n=1 Tax=Flavobacterium arsenatis TaxID=1484332 RepID=A0ABU1TNX8_9FLAO|nr:decaprenyl-phosphate phosphoribosyltransferase [Flavobacterium arsenatis]MDR6967667.1 4-hydroxybenzoate polyprenyltransferase [Flavobacterium arsenatis]